jgi:hypothetical protein
MAIRSVASSEDDPPPSGEKRTPDAQDEGERVVPIGLAPPPPAEEEPACVLEADVDGRRVKIVAKDEIVLECGQASITLRRNGKIIVRGTYVETYSTGTNRVKGGQVRIN